MSNIKRTVQLRALSEEIGNVETAFFGYFVGNCFDIDNASEVGVNVLKTPIPFGAAKITHYFETAAPSKRYGQGKTIQAFVIVKDGETMAFATRVIAYGFDLSDVIVIPESIGFVQTKYRPFHGDGVMELIASIPADPYSYSEH